MRTLVSRSKAPTLAILAALPLTASSTQHVLNAGFIAGPAASESYFTAHGPRYSVKLTPNEAVVHASSTFRIRWVNANPRPRLRGQRLMSSTANYFLGNDPANWRTNVRRYAEVKYRTHLINPYESKGTLGDVLKKTPCVFAYGGGPVVTARAIARES